MTTRPARQGCPMQDYHDDRRDAAIDTGSDAHAGLLRHGHDLGRRASCDGTCGMAGCRRPYFDASGLTRYRDEAIQASEVFAGRRDPVDLEEGSHP